MKYFLRDSMKSGKLLKRCGTMVFLRGTAWPSLVIPTSPTIGHILPKLAFRQKSSAKISSLLAGAPHEKSRIISQGWCQSCCHDFRPSNDSSDWIRLGQSHYYAFFLGHR